MGMNRYKENNCRICQKVFCCKKCREQHETLAHKIQYVDCNICLYGKTLLRSDSAEGLIKHIKDQHWPLHCTICKKFFGSFDELLKHNVCRREPKNQNFEKSPNTPIQSQGENKCYLATEKKISSNPSMFSNLATSTPLQRIEENNLLEKSHNQEVITPVEGLNPNKDKKYFTDSISLKRKVTFCETPITETYKKKDYMLEPGIGIKLEDQIRTPSPGNNSTAAVFYSAKQYQQVDSPCQNDQNQIRSPCIDNIIRFKEKINMKNAEFEHEDSILWISAVNTSPDFIEGTKPFIGINLTTPVVAKLKKRQVNVVIPTPIRKQNTELQVSNNLHLAAQNIPKSEENASKTQQNGSESEQSVENVDKVNNTNDSGINYVNEILTEASINPPKRLWTSMSKLVKTVTNAVQELSNATYNSKTPLKRSILQDDFSYGPYIKRYKLTEIKCRRPIRDFSEYSGECTENSKYECNSITVGTKKRTVDKATQTDPELSENYFPKLKLK